MKRRKAFKTQMLRVRITEYEAVKLNFYAHKHDKTVSKIIREYIRRLPSVKMNFSEFKTYYEETTGIEISEINLNISILKNSILSLEDWLEMIKDQPDGLAIDEWAEIAGW